MIGAAAFPHTVHATQESTQHGHFLAELNRVSIVEFLRLIKFGMAASRRIGPHTANALQPVAPAAQRLLQMRRMGAINHEECRIAVRFDIGPFDRLVGNALNLGHSAVLWFRSPSPPDGGIAINPVDLQ